MWRKELPHLFIFSLNLNTEGIFTKFTFSDHQNLDNQYFLFLFFTTLGVSSKQHSSLSFLQYQQKGPN